MAGAENDHPNARADGMIRRDIGNAFAGFAEGIPAWTVCAPLIRNSREAPGRMAELRLSDAQLARNPARRPWRRKSAETRHCSLAGREPPIG